jgi:hypothetical protein
MGSMPREDGWLGGSDAPFCVRVYASTHEHTASVIRACTACTACTDSKRSVDSETS